MLAKATVLAKASILAIDIGTTRCKAGLMASDGTAFQIVDRPTVARQAIDGSTYYDAEELWGTVTAIIQAVRASPAPTPIRAIGIASMAETGLLVDRRTGAPRTGLIPWFDNRAQKQMEEIRQASDPLDRFVKTGLHPNAKSALPKLLWLHERDGGILRGAEWLSAADYVAYRLTGKMATDYSLAARTYAFRIDTRAWDEEWIRSWGLESELFPEVRASGQPVGTVMSSGIGLTPGTPVSIAGHDHLCAALAAGEASSRLTFDSMGTAETLIGTLEGGGLDKAAFESGLLYGRHLIGDQYYWMGALPSSGGSIEWLRSQLGDPALSYSEIDALLSQAGAQPTGILYFPFLSGRGAPNATPGASGAFVGLRAGHGRADLAKAVLEGTAYEIETIRRTAENGVGSRAQRMAASGGGTQNRHWIQIKADVSGLPLDVLSTSEAALVGAAMAAGIGRGLYADLEEAATCLAPRTETVLPNPGRHAAYENLYEKYAKLAVILDEYSN